MIDCYKNCKDLQNGVCPPMRMLCPKKLAEHDIDLLDEVAKRINSMHYDTCDDVTRRVEHQLKVEVFKVINEMKVEIEKHN